MCGGEEGWVVDLVRGVQGFDGCVKGTASTQRWSPEREKNRHSERKHIKVLRAPLGPGGPRPRGEVGDGHTLEKSSDLKKIPPGQEDFGIFFRFWNDGKVSWISQWFLNVSKKKNPQNSEI